MDIYWCLKAITQLSKIYGASPVNNKIIFFGGHNSHFGDRANIHMEHQNIQPLFLKAGNYINVHLNDNGPNSKLKCCYNELKPVLILKYGMTNLLPCRMKSIFVESWYVFNISAGNIIRYIFSKKNTPPHPSKLNHKYTGIWCIYPSIFWIKFWRNQWNLTPHSCIYWGTIHQDWLSYYCPPIKG